MKDTKNKLNKTLLHSITFTFPLGYYLENDLVPTSSEKIGGQQAFEEFEKNWKQLINDNDKQSIEGYHMDTEPRSASSKEES